MIGHDRWDELADAVLTHDIARERSAWRELTCVVCGDPVIPDEFLCAEHFVMAAHRRADTERPPAYRRWFGPVAS